MNLFDQIVSSYNQFLILRILAWTMFGSIAWVFLSVPFYIIRRVFLYSYEITLRYLLELRRPLQDVLRRPLPTGDTCYHRFISNHEYKYAFVDSESLSRKALKELRDVASEMKIYLNNINTSIRDGCHTFASLTAKLPLAEKIGSGMKTPEQVISGLEDAAKSYRTTLTLYFSVIFIVGLTTYNTFMLNLFFSELLDIYLIYSLGLKVSHILSLFFTGIEIALGYVFWILGKDKSENSITGNMGQTTVVVFALFLAIFEGYLYSRISLEVFSQMRERVVSDEMPMLVQKYFMTPIGFVVVFLLFILSHLLFKALDDHRKVRYIKGLIDQQKRISQRNADLVENLERLRENYKNFRDSVQEYNAPTELKDGTAQLYEKLDSIKQYVETLMKEREKSGASFVQPVTDGEKQHIYYSHIAYVIGIIIVMIFLTAVASNIAASLGSRHSGVLGLFCSGFIVMMFLICGHLAMTAPKITEGDGGPVRIERNSWVTKVLTWLLTASAAVGSIGLIITFLVGPQLFAICAVIAALVFLTLIGPSLGSILNMSHLILSWLWAKTIRLGWYFALAALYLLSLIVHLVKFALDLLAQPVIMFRKEAVHERPQHKLA